MAGETLSLTTEKKGKCEPLGKEKSDQGKSMTGVEVQDGTKKRRG